MGLKTFFNLFLKIVFKQTQQQLNSIKLSIIIRCSLSRNIVKIEIAINRRYFVFVSLIIPDPRFKLKAQIYRHSKLITLILHQKFHTYNVVSNKHYRYKYNLLNVEIYILVMLI